MRSVGAVLSILWIVGIGAATWLLVTEDPTSPSWLVRFVVIRPRQDPNIVGLDGFGLVFQLVDPVRLFIVMLGPVVVVWLCLTVWRWLFGGRRRNRIR
ncbi:MAG: hypothetical protein Q8L22_22455 [Reyranella sp.]|nr:hypothetical protein [Reyranella sp.]